MTHVGNAVKIGIRFDDITPTMNWGNFCKIQKVLDELNIKPLLGVVPDNRDENLKVDCANEEFWDWVRDCQAKGYTIAMHGYQHLYQTKRAGIFPLNCFSEFAGQSAALQDKKIAAGKRILDQKGVQTNVFMAPGHSFDRTTVKVLAKHGFQYISDGYGKHVYTRKDSKIKFIPIMSENEFQQEGYELTTAVFHLNTCDRNMLRNCETFLRKNRKNIVSYADFFDCKCKVQTVGERMEELVKAIQMRIKIQKRRSARRLGRN